MILEIKDIRFKYNSLDILSNVSMEIKEGEVTGIMGPNGSGKTTILKCINRILEPYKGSILVKNRDLKELSNNDIAKNMGYVPQRDGGRFPRTVFDTILMGRKPYIQWAPTSKDLYTVSKIVDCLNLQDIAMRDINQLSGGQRQKVIIGRALAQEPEILLLDEPTTNLDLKHELEVMDIIWDQSRGGVTAILSVHDLNIAVRYCDNIIMLKNGRIFAVGGKEVLTPENIKSVYGVNAKVIKDSEMNIIVPLSPN